MIMNESAFVDNIVIINHKRRGKTMPFGFIEDLQKEAVNNPEAKGATKRVPLGPDQGWDSHIMRVFDLEAGGYTPKHVHDWPHINYILEGEGTLLVDGKVQEVKFGNYAYIPSNTEHQFKASAEKPLKFMCIIPKEALY